ncbi:ABC-type transport system periplasmic substrate-binding protein (probable substrate phosphate) [Natronomonas moolapensis 8.8.11]|uniref:ABC-type transport system periplasmic substrate-binding protein (Probable substrate phosphate) n=1 Tax=Natronomonas moolapensis (strain DSM 18674 / CECT 7526 / JCM 14361 / 8.8.11) TaxID=268739 RepID=M1XL27_NATM8|nr:PstS family phosphate ABC transporter substrate-binding protein [Natronomonas moolapensis]CCQ36960.1 ABC-type transport system periplasmic substrate-binding protein (probable substrate phosphate) [Natronomonas moolapensis 8.8.11]
MAPSHLGRLTRRTTIKAIGGGAGALAFAGCTETEGNGNGNGNGEGDMSGDGGDSESLSGEINIAGSSTVFPLMSAIAEEYSAENSEVSIDISSTGSGGGFSNFFCVGETDFNNASRPIKEEERNLCSENDVEYIELIAATDALTVVINNDNDFATEMTVDELAQIWQEDPAQTWDEVRDEWPNEEIERYGAADTSGTFDYFVENVQGAEAGHTDDYQATEQDNTIAQGVAGSEYAIGYFGFAYWFQNQDQITPVAVDNGNGPVLPSLDTAASGEYQPLSRSLYTYPSMSSLAEDHVADFARYFVDQSDNEQIVAEEVGYVPATQDVKEAQMQKLEDAIEEAQ